jgi:hypothetical protein
MSCGDPFATFSVVIPGSPLTRRPGMTAEFFDPYPVLRSPAEIPLIVS